MIKNITNIFFISSFMSIITLTYIGIAFRRSGRPSSIPYELFPIFIPILYGLFGLLNYYIITKYGNNYSILVGAIFGLFLSIIGRFVLNLPIKIFGYTKNTAYKVHIYAIIIYSLIFRFILSSLFIDFIF